jgi:TRAP-type C4-dicarboxylate transport system permease small subunit
MSIIDKLDKWANLISKWISWIAGIGVVSMLGFTFADIIGVKIFNSPIPGSIEIVALLGVVITAFGMAYTQSQHANIQVEFFVQHLPKRIQAGVLAFSLLLSIILFALLSWQSFKYGYSLQQSGEVSMTARIPTYPFVYAMAFCCIPLCFVLIVEFLKSIMKVVNK